MECGAESAAIQFSLHKTRNLQVENGQIRDRHKQG